VERDRLRVNISSNDNNLNLTIESKEDLNLAIETLELMFKKSKTKLVSAGVIGGDGTSNG